MDRSAAIFGAALFSLVAGLTSVASSKVGEPDVNGAVAAAVRSHMWWMDERTLMGGDKSLPKLVICLESDMPLKIDAIADELSETIVRPIPMSSCTSERIEGDFGMFTALTNYYGSAGEAAVHLEVVKVACSSTKICIVDIDDHGSSNRYEMTRQANEWSVTKQTMRWIV